MRYFMFNQNDLLGNINEQVLEYIADIPICIKMTWISDFFFIFTNIFQIFWTTIEYKYTTIRSLHLKLEAGLSNMLLVANWQCKYYLPN